MNIIFLDFDFVLNSRSSFCYSTITGKGDRIASPDIYTIEFIDYMFFLIPDLHIVVSSSWRDFKSLERTKSYLKDDFKLFHWFKVVDQTPPSRDRFRGKEIKSWLQDTKLKVDQYVIIDDDNDFLDEQLPRFVNTSESGFTSKDFNKCLELFGYTANPYDPENVVAYRKYRGYIDD